MSFGEPWRVIRDATGDQIKRTDGKTLCVDFQSHHSLRAVACVNALAGLDPSAVLRVVEAAECLSKADSELSVICHGRLPRSLEELKKVYPMFRSAYEDLRSALVALKESTTERKEEAPPSAAAVSAAAVALAAAAHVPGPPSPPLRCRRCGHSRERHRRADHGCLDCDCGGLFTGECGG